MNTNQSYHIYINQNAGSVQNMGEDVLEAVLKESGLGIEALYMLPPDQLFEKLKTENREHRILVGGGDGTITSAAEILSDLDIAFGIVPLGTMNLLAKDLNIPVRLNEALQAYADETEQIQMDATYANGYLFLCSAGIGTMPDTSSFREDNRSQNHALLVPRLTWFVLDRLDPKCRKAYNLKLDNTDIKLKSASLVISNNQYAPSQNWNSSSLKRPSLQEGVIALYSAVPSNFWEKCRILLKIGTGGWHKDPKIKKWLAKEIKMDCAHDQEDVSLDGETKTLTTPICFTIKPKHLKLLAPKGSSSV